MKKDIRILYLEDVPADVVLANHELRKAGLAFSSKRVETREAFVRELERNLPDLILSDHGLPSFTGFAALAVARERCPDVPFIFVTDSLGEEMTIRTFVSGATDYVLKRTLSNLVPAVQRALREAQERVSLRRRDQELRDSEERYRRIVELCPDALFVVQSDGRIDFADGAAAALLGEASANRLRGKLISDYFEAGRWDRMLERLQERREQGAVTPFVEETLIRADGVRVEVELSATPMTFQARPAMQVIAHDLTERRKTETTLRESEARKAAILETAPGALLFCDSGGFIQEWNSAAQRLFGYSRDQAIGRPMDELIIPPALREAYRLEMAHYLANGAGDMPSQFISMRLRRADGTEFRARIAISRVQAPDPAGFTALIRDLP